MISCRRTSNHGLCLTGKKPCTYIPVTFKHPPGGTGTPDREQLADVRVESNKKRNTDGYAAENSSRVSRITAVGGYFQMSLTSHLVFQKHFCCRQCIMCERPRYVGLWRQGGGGVGGGIMLFGACSEGKIKLRTCHSRDIQNWSGRHPREYGLSGSTTSECGPKPSQVSARKMPFNMCTTICACLSISLHACRRQCFQKDAQWNKTRGGRSLRDLCVTFIQTVFFMVCCARKIIQLEEKQQ